MTRSGFIAAKRLSPMRKRILSTKHEAQVEDEVLWLDLDAIADVEVTSEAPEHPVESALLPAHNSEWQAAEPGEQTIRLHFETPQFVHRIRLEFREENQ